MRISRGHLCEIFPFPLHNKVIAEVVTTLDLLDGRKTSQSVSNINKRKTELISKRQLVGDQD